MIKFVLKSPDSKFSKHLQRKYLIEYLEKENILDIFKENCDDKKRDYCKISQAFLWLKTSQGERFWHEHYDKSLNYFKEKTQFTIY